MAAHKAGLDLGALPVVFASSGTAVFFGLSQQWWGVIGVITGILCAVLGLIFHIWFNMRYRR